MTRKDYELIARAVDMSRQGFGRTARAAAEDEAIDRVARNVARALSKDNPRFDRSRFLRAAGVEEW